MTKFPHPAPPTIPVIISGAVPLFTICSVCGEDGVSLAVVGGTAAGLPGVNVAVNVWNAIGFVKSTGTGAGVMVIPFVAVSVHPVVALVY